MDIATLQPTAPARMVVRRHLTKGFTLIELLAVMAIFTFITALVLTNQNRFGSKVVLENLAYDVALTIRKAQVYGTAVQRFGTNNFSVGYGIHAAVSSPSSYILFGDAVSQDGLYNAGELVETENLGQGYAIKDICSTSGGVGGTETCGLGSIDIFFKRPDPDAYMSVNGASGISNPGNLQARGRIVLQSPKGDQASVIIDASGQISVQ